ncbi:hypothetical protein TcasGA2_TC032554 [Tribolium castaneum]|uniref:Uncharacterized protein n=1 Tax=Tribolium castaneum TaxID=7070 RepID=A0A139WKW7_TRICA|nr:hypothetical protein TcasGA2_TC032554 [Tribolium castaneum]
MPEFYHKNLCCYKIFLNSMGGDGMAKYKNVNTLGGFTDRQNGIQKALKDNTGKVV